jgi:hypothetical protein
MSITLVPDAPKSRKCRPYAWSRKEAEVEDLWVKEQLDLRHIEEAPSPIVSPIFFIAKKGSNEKRVIMDYRWLNSYTVKDQNPMVRIGDIMESLQGYSVFSSSTSDMGITIFEFRSKIDTKQPSKLDMGPTYQRLCTLASAMLRLSSKGLSAEISRSS